MRGGARAVLDLVGATSTVSLAMASCARGGHVVICGLMGGDITLSLPVIPMRPLTLQGSYVGAPQALTGIMSVNGGAGGAALRVGLPVVDMVTGLNAALGIMFALNERQRSARRALREQRRPNREPRRTQACPRRPTRCTPVQ